MVAVVMVVDEGAFWVCVHGMYLPLACFKGDPSVLSLPCLP